MNSIKKAIRESIPEEMEQLKEISNTARQVTPRLKPDGNANRSILLDFHLRFWAAYEICRENDPICKMVFSNMK